MNWVHFFQTPQMSNLSHFPSPTPPDNYNLSRPKISSSILVIILVLAIIFFVSGILHLLARLLFFSPDERVPDDSDNATALRGQLQQLFHLHDAGLDRSCIDNLPIFVYKSIIGLRHPFDCAVCLCEFDSDDKLRLLPKCSHAFHIDCIDTWLLSHSTCPLCRGSLLPVFSSGGSSGGCSPAPAMLALESGRGSSEGIGSGRESVGGSANACSQLGIYGEVESGGDCDCDNCRKTGEFGAEDEALSNERVVPVKLGKFRSVEVGLVGGECNSSSNCNLDGRRCFSMGSFEYVLDETSVLQVTVRPPVRKQTSKKTSLQLTLHYRSAMSECGCYSSRDVFKGFNLDTSTGIEIHGDCSTSTVEADVGKGKGESFSISKIWLRSKKDKQLVEDPSRRAFSFRLPFHQAAADELKLKRNNGRTASEVDMRRWGSSRGELGLYTEDGSCNGLESQANPPSFAKRTLLWVVGRQNKMAHSSSTVNA